MISVTINVSSEDGDFTAAEQAVLAALTGGTAPAPAVESAADPEPAAPAKAPRKPRQTRSTRAAVLEDTKEEEPAADEDDADDVGETDEDLVGGGAATLEEAIALAQDAVGNGKTAKVKAALKASGGTKVGQLKGDQIQAFVDAMQD